MSRKNRTTKDNVGIVYLFTNELYERENMYKYGITINPFQRKRVQSNSTPPTYPFYDRIVMFSKSYKDIDFWSKRWTGVDSRGVVSSCRNIQRYVKGIS